ncbi:MAG TPA: DUF222 domain-containing protein [Jatrophihabitantaceae bacterium]|nr:DUF222 domain-containing protein [Jatrophihabitantaceae bacterium]
MIDNPSVAIEPSWVRPVRADEVALWAAEVPIGLLGRAFTAPEPSELSQDGNLAMAQYWERMVAHAQARQARHLAHIETHPDQPPMPAPEPPAECASRREVVAARMAARERAHHAQMSAVQEVALALRWSYGYAAERMHAASVLVTQLPATLDRVGAGELALVHAESLVRAVKDLDAATTAKVQARVLPRAGEQTVSEFRAAIRRAVAKLDPRDADERHHAAVQDRRVCYQPAEDAMAWINTYLPAADAQAVMTVVQAVADRLQAAADPDDCRTADQYRADALVAICCAALNGHTLHRLPKWQGRRPQVQVMVALSTLLGIDEQPGELAGYGPIPAEAARRIAADPSGTWTRLVTDDLGQLIDYGRTVYRPPQDLIDHVTARDRTCRGPGCHRHARRCELDHVVPYSQGGQTNAANLGPGWHPRTSSQTRLRLGQRKTPRRHLPLDHAHRPALRQTPRDLPHRPNAPETRTLRRRGRTATVLIRAKRAPEHPDQPDTALRAIAAVFSRR